MTQAIDDIAATPEAAQADGSTGKRVLMTAVKVAISAVLIYYLVRRAELSEIWVALNSANLGLVALSFMLHGIGYFASSHRWRLLLKDQQHDVPVLYLMRSYAVAMFFNNLLPSTIGGDGYRAYDTAKYGVPKATALATVIVERFLGMFALMIFAVVAFVLATSMISQTEGLWIWAAGICVVMAAGVWLIFFKGTSGDGIREKIAKLPGGGILQKILAKIQDAFAPFEGRTAVLASTMVISLVFQLNVIFHYYLISEALGLNIEFNFFLVFIPISIFIQTLPISINGIGVREGIYVSFLTHMLGAATPAESIAFSWIAYGMILLLGILGGVIYAFRK